MDAARTVMRFLLQSQDVMQHVEISVIFIRTLLVEMISFIRELIRDHVRVLGSADASDREALGQRGDIKQVHANPVVSELEECDSYLRSLRALQSDMDRLQEINAGVTENGSVIARAASFVPSGFANGVAVESVVEKSLLTGTPCLGMYWMSKEKRVLQSESMRSLARLIAYSFIAAPSVDSFFAGLHILRSSGHHVQTVLAAFYRDTSVRFVRDRLAAHLAHWGENFKPSKRIQRMEALYPNNCYVTELSRAWAARATTARAGHAHAPSRASVVSPTEVACGNIPDVAVAPEATMGQIGTVSADDAQTILRCSTCQEGKCQTHTGQTLKKHASGYLHMTASWAEKLTAAEFDRICLDGGSAPDVSPGTVLEYALRHKDWRTVRKLATGSAIQPPQDKQDVTFIERIFQEAAWANEPHSLGRPELARIKKLFTDTVDQPLAFHAEMLRWLTTERHLPQMALMYLRRYGLGRTETEVADLVATGQSPLFEFIATGRLGNGALGAVAHLTAHSEEDSLRDLAVWMISGRAPASLEQMVCDFPALAQVAAQETAGPTGESAGDIFRTKSWKQDVAIQEMLSDVFPELDLDAECAEPLAAPRTAVEEAEYLLAQGRPCAAFAACGELAKPQLQRAARRVAMYNLFDDGIVASAIAFLDLFGETTETLRVDVQAARTILSTPSAASKRSVIELFLTFGAGEQTKGQALLQGLKLLEESAWAKEPPISDNGPAPPPAGGGFESPWHLVALFCRVHNLPRSLTLLHELARNGDWVMFLHESDVQQCPIETVKDVTQFYFGRSPLRSHLNILLGIERVSEGQEVVANRCGGLPHVLRQDAAGWLTQQAGAASLTLCQRKSAIFAHTEDHEVLFKKAFSLRSFSTAQRHFASIPEARRAAATAAAGANTDALVAELQRINGCGNTVKGDTVEREQVNLRLDRAPEVEAAEEQVEQSIMAQTRQALESRDLRSLRRQVDSKRRVTELVSLLIERAEELAQWCSRDLEDLVAWVDQEQLKPFADRIAQSTDSDALLHIAYFAYVAAFIDEETLNQFVDSNPRLHARITGRNDAIGELVSATGSGKLKLINSAKAAGSFALGLMADQILAQTTVDSANPQSILLSLGALLKVSSIYRSIGLLKKHLAVNQSAHEIAFRLRNAGTAI